MLKSNMKNTQMALARKQQVQMSLHGVAKEMTLLNPEPGTVKCPRMCGSEGLIPRSDDSAQSNSPAQSVRCDTPQPHCPG